MTSSNYLPPFSQEQRAAVVRGNHTHNHQAATPLDTELEVTYADFLGDEVED